MDGGQNGAMTSSLSTPPAIRAGALGGGPQPVLSSDGELVLRPWEPADAPVFLAAYRDPEIQHWHTRQPRSEDQVREWFEQYRLAGFVLEGTKRSAAVHSDGRHDMHLHARIRGDRPST
jgi:Acetyltransferase (GNAT) domain